MNHECTTTQSCRDLDKANHSCEAVGKIGHAIRQCVAQPTTLPPGATMETNCTFAPIANSDHTSTVTYNIGDEWTYTCNRGFHLDGRENSITFQSNSCVEGSRHDLNPPSSCVANLGTSAPAIDEPEPEVSCGDTIGDCVVACMQEKIYGGGTFEEYMLCTNTCYSLGLPDVLPAACLK